MIDPNAEYRLEEAAIRSGISYTSLYTAVRRGDLPASRAAGVWKILGRDLRTWASQNQHQPKIDHWLSFDAALAAVDATRDALLEAIRNKAVVTRAYAGRTQVNAESLADWWRSERDARQAAEAAHAALERQLADRSAELTDEQLRDLLSLADRLRSQNRRS